MLKYMLDTNIAIYVIKRRPPQMLGVFNEHAGQMCISAVTLAELIHGAEKSERKAHNLAQVEDFVSRLVVLDYTPKAAAHYGDIRADLERKGTPIGVNDLHIAGHAWRTGWMGSGLEFAHLRATRPNSRLPALLHEASRFVQRVLFRARKVGTATPCASMTERSPSASGSVGLGGEVGEYLSRVGGDAFLVAP